MVEKATCCPWRVGQPIPDTILAYHFKAIVWVSIVLQQTTKMNTSWSRYCIFGITIDSNLDLQQTYALYCITFIIKPLLKVLPPQPSPCIIILFMLFYHWSLLLNSVLCTNTIYWERYTGSRYGRAMRCK